MHDALATELLLWPNVTSARDTNSGNVRSKDFRPAWNGMFTSQISRHLLLHQAYLATSPG